MRMCACACMCVKGGGGRGESRNANLVTSKRVRNERDYGRMCEILEYVCKYTSTTSHRCVRVVHFSI